MLLAGGVGAGFLAARALLRPGGDSFGGSREKAEDVDLEGPRGKSLLDRLNRFAAKRYNEYAR